ncbi:MAG: SUMF1/EgtB/PvdO family nonheme iron enzyme [Planctomycetota bacterium]|jgi:hypothetical protein
MIWERAVGAVLCLVAIATAQGSRGMIEVPEEFDPVAPGVLPDYGRFEALLIGVNDYAPAGDPKRYPDLEGPAQDVRTLRRVLSGRLGFRVRTLVDGEVTKQAILDRLAAYKRRLRRGDGKRDMGDNLLVWFAGHGEKGADEAWNWKWVLPQKDQTISFREVRSLLREIDARHILLVSDSCFSGGMKPVRGYARQQPAKRIAAARDRSFQIISSGDLTTVQDVYKDGNSPFARAVLQQLEHLGIDRPPVAAWELFAEVRKMVDLASAREPVFGFDDAEEGFGPAAQQGQFYFVNPRFLRRETEKTRGLGEHRMSRGLRDRLEFAGRGGKFLRYRLRDSADPAPMVVVGSAKVSIPGRKEMAFVPAFLIDAHEVTVGQYRRFLDASGDRASTRYQNLQGYAESDRPIVGLTLQQARAYAAWAGKSIPTEAEWYAAAAVRWTRSADGRRMQADVFEKPWHYVDPRPDVKLAWSVYPPRRIADEPDVSCWGAERMATGVREWCVPLDGDRRFGIVRGGTVVRASARDELGEELPPALRRMRADAPRNNVGFRCVLRDLGE